MGSDGDEISGADFVGLVNQLLSAVETDFMSTKITAIALVLSFSKVMHVCCYIHMNFVLCICNCLN